MNSRPLRIAINGFGRIGRHVLRAMLTRPGCGQLQLVAINDLWDVDTLAHLLRFDSAHGRFDGEISLSDSVLTVSHGQQQQRIDILHESDPGLLPWQALDIDVVLECTGLFRSRELASRHLQAGARQVIIGAAPFDSVDIAVVVGVNDQAIQRSDQLISSVSCTTQALVPLVAVLDEAFGIDTAFMTEIHAVTADQNVLDQGHRDWRRARAAGQNIIPTTSSAIGALRQVMPHMEGRIAGYSIRVPTINVAAIDLTAMLSTAVTAEQVNQLFEAAAENQYLGIMQVTDLPLVSSDFNHQPYSLIVDSLQTMSLGRQIKVLAWYDNEWGYANRLLDLCLRLAALYR